MRHRMGYPYCIAGFWKQRRGRDHARPAHPASPARDAQGPGEPGPGAAGQLRPRTRRRATRGPATRRARDTGAADPGAANPGARDASARTWEAGQPWLRTRLHAARCHPTRHPLTRGHATQGPAPGSPDPAAPNPARPAGGARGPGGNGTDAAPVRGTRAIRPRAGIRRQDRNGKARAAGPAARSTRGLSACSPVTPTGARPGARRSVRRSGVRIRPAEVASGLTVGASRAICGPRALRPAGRPEPGPPTGLGPGPDIP